MLGTSTLAILVALQIGQINSHAVNDIQFQGSFDEPDSYQAFEMDIDESSGMMFREWPEPQDNTRQCNGLESEVTITTIFRQSDQSGCYRFQTPGFGGSGYPNAGGGLPNYDCRFMLRFDGSNVFGTLTVPSATFDFQPEVGNTCKDFLRINNLIPLAGQPSDPEDSAPSSTVVRYCGMITDDKIFHFDNTPITIRLRADDTVSHDGAEVIICFS